MKYKAVIEVKDPERYFEKALEPEDKVFKNQRAGYDLKRKKDFLFINAWAKDVSALRSILNTLTKLIQVFEKTSEVLEE